MRHFLPVAAAVLIGVAPAFASAQERVALLIGNGDYANAPEAETAVRDVRAVAEALRDTGWEVDVALNLERPEMRKALKSFAESAAGAEDVLFYYSGHALRTGGRTYLAPVDQEAGSLTEVLFDGVPLELVLRVAELASGEAVIFLDGAQLDGFEPTDFVEPGLASVEAPESVVVVSAAPPGRAIRRSPLRESRFARLIVDRFLLPGAEVMATANEVGPPTWVTGQSQSEFVLVPPPESLAEGGLEQEIELAYWRAAERSGTAEDYQRYLERYPDGVFARFARERLGLGPEETLGDRQPQIDPDVQAEQALDLSRARKRDVQAWLRALGHEPGAVDGLLGPNTRDALRSWQAAQGDERTGYLTREQLDRLSRQGRAAVEEQERRAEEERRVAEAEDRGYWAATGAEGTPQGYRAYLERYPDGVHAREARAALAQIEEAQADQQTLRERQAYRRAEQRDTAESYRDYLAEYPEGIFRDEALARLDDIEGAERDEAQRRRIEQEEAALSLSQQDRLSVEQRLRSLGFAPGPIDGTIDERARAAIEEYQSSRGIAETGYLDRSTVVTLVRETDQAPQGQQLVIEGADVIRGLIEAFGQGGSQN